MAARVAKLLIFSCIGGVPTLIAAQCIGTVAGESGGGDTALSTGLQAPSSVAVDSWGNLFISNSGSNNVLLVDAGGFVSTWAGIGSASYSGDGGLATLAGLNAPAGLAVDPAGTVYISDAGNNVVRAVSPVNGSITTVAGNYFASAANLTDNIPATSATLSAPLGVALDALSNLYIIDTGNYIVRRVVQRSGTISTVAGTPTSGGFTCAVGTFVELRGITINVYTGVVYVADSGCDAIFSITVSGVAPAVVAIVVGSLTHRGYNGDNGATSTWLNAPTSVVFDSRGRGGTGTLYIADTGNDLVRAVSSNTSAPFVITVAGAYSSKYSASADSSSSSDWAAGYYSAGTTASGGGVPPGGGIATTAQLWLSAGQFGAGGATARTTGGLAVDAASATGALYFADTGNNVVRKVEGGIIWLAAGIPSAVVDGGFALTAQLAAATDVAVDGGGNLLILDSANSVVRKVMASSGVISTVVGSAASGYGCSGDGASATGASLAAPQGFSVSASTGNLYIADTSNWLVRMVSASTGIITTVAGTPRPSAAAQSCAPTAGGPLPGDGGAAILAALCFPFDVAVDPLSGDLIIADTYANAVRRVSVATGNISTVAGTGMQGYSGDAIAGTAAQLNHPWGVTVDGTGAVFVADTMNSIVRRIDPGSGWIYTVAGTVPTIISESFSWPNAAYGGDGGLATQAFLNNPSYAAVVTGQTLYIADFGNGVIRSVSLSAGGAITTFAGNFNAGFGDAGDGDAATLAQMYAPNGVRIDGYGNVLIAEGTRVRAVVVSSGGAVSCPTGYRCPCATPIACTDAAAFCPGNTGNATTAVTGGFYSAPAAPANAPRTQQVRCPVGAYCTGGVRVPCTPGTVGTRPLQMAPQSCSPCPAGTYNPLSGQSALATSCLPCPAGADVTAAGAFYCAVCPAGTFAQRSPFPTVGTNRSACVQCPGGTGSLYGAAACFTLGSAALTMSVQNMATIQQLAPTPADPKANHTEDVRLSLLIGGPIIALAALIVFLGVSLHLGGAAPCCKRLTSLLSRLSQWDAFGLYHVIDDGQPSTMRKTELGFAMTVAVILTIAALTCALVVGFVVNNDIVQQSLLPAELVTLRNVGLPSSSSYAAPQQTSPALFAPQLQQGLLITVALAGPACSTLSDFTASGLLYGSFRHTVTTDSGSAAAVHTLSCPDCSLGPLSELVLSVDPSCQQVVLTATAVGAQGTITAVQMLAQGAAAAGAAGAATATAGGLLESVQFVIAPTLEVYTVQPVVTWFGATSLSSRGYTLAAAPPQVTRSGNPASLQLTITLGVTQEYVSVFLQPVLSVTQLASSIIGLFSLSTVFGWAFAMFEFFSIDCNATARAAPRSGSVAATLKSILRSKRNVLPTAASPVVYTAASPVMSSAAMPASLQLPSLAGSGADPSSCSPSRDSARSSSGTGGGTSRPLPRLPVPIGVAVDLDRGPSAHP